MKLIFACLLAVIVLALGMPAAEAKCGSLLRGINWKGRKKGGYSKGAMADDFSPYNYFRGHSNCKLTGSGLEVKLKKGCYGTGSKGCGLYGRAPLTSRPQVATLEYTVQFGKGFDWVRGGKLLGLCAGKCPTGCKKNIKTSDGFSARIMWTDIGKSGGMHTYAYYSNMKGHKGCGDEYRFKKGGKDFKPSPGKDYRVRLVVDAKKGRMTSYVNGSKMSSQSGMKLGGKIDSLMFDTFFGGSSDMAARKDEKLIFKSLYVWDGDCGGSSGKRSSKSGGSKYVEESGKKGKKGGSSGGGSGGGGGSWKAHTIDKKSYPNKSSVKTKNLKIGTIFNGGFCVKFNSVNVGKKTCKDFVVEVNMNPSIYKLQKHTTSLRKIASDTKKGYYLFGRRKGLSKETKPGISRKGQFCAISHIKALYTKSQIANSFTVNSICNGEKMGKKLTSVKP